MRGPANAAGRERLSQVAFASGVAFVMALVMLLVPVDFMLWQMSDRLSDREASGRIGYVRVENGIIGGSASQSRLDLANRLDALRGNGVERVFLNIPLSTSRDRAADARLARAMDAWGKRLVIVDRVLVEDGTYRFQRPTAALFAKGHDRVLMESSRNWPGFAWNLPYAYDPGSGMIPEFGAALAGQSDARVGRYWLSYGFRNHRKLLISDEDLRVGAGGRAFPRTVVIGTPSSDEKVDYVVPGQPTVDPSFVAIYAAETLMSRSITFVPGWLVVGLVAAFLATASMIEAASRRRVAYAASLAIPAYLFCVSTLGGLRVELSYCLVLLPLFGFLRSRSNWRARLATMDPDTGLPSLRACATQLAARKGASGFVAVAKIHRYETILRSFDAPQRIAYVLKLVERIRITDPELTIYTDGHYLGWIVDDMDEAALRGHFEGLRAIFAAPVPVDDQSMDVSITFGAAEFDASGAENALGAALEAVEQTNEALEPIRFAAKDGGDDTLWDLSLRSRIDTAMEAGEVFCVYQPKFDIVSGRMVGVEALVRWQDPERGFISPIHFVMQCEKAGRMEYLTRYVLQSACSAGRLLAFRGHDLTMAVNISATLLTDMRIVGIVRNVLQATEFDPARLVLEITETARIRDLDQARTILAALRSLGARIAMDDFGVGAANFEALQTLPVDEIKIDRQFVAAACREVKSKAIVSSIVALGHDSRIAVVAEGAETVEDVAMLRDLGCRLVQGYALAKPMPLTNLLTSIGTETGITVNA